MDHVLHVPLLHLYLDSLVLFNYSRKEFWRLVFFVISKNFVTASF